MKQLTAIDCHAAGEPLRVITSSGRNCPSFGASESPASTLSAMRVAETVSGSGQLTGPACMSGQPE